MSPPEQDHTPSLPVFRMAFAIVGSLMFGASTIVGLSVALAGTYTTTLRCDRATNQCEIQQKAGNRAFPLENLKSVESRQEQSDRNRSPSHNLYAAYTGGHRDFLCAVPVGSEGVARLDALAADAEGFLREQRPSLDLRCEGQVARPLDGFLMASFSALLAIACVVTLVRALRQQRVLTPGNDQGKALR